MTDWGLLFCDCFFFYFPFFSYFCIRKQTSKTRFPPFELFLNHVFMLKKSISFFAVALLLALPVKAQFLDLNQNTNRAFLGAQLGQAGTNTEYHGIGFGVSLSVFGVYADFLWSTPQYTNDNHLINELWDDYSAYTINLGYQIPIFRWLRIAPIIGYSQTNYGYTDIGTLNQHIDEDGDIINHHDYIVKKRFHELNYGGAIFVQLFGHMEVYAAYTKRSIYGGLSFDLTWLK